MIDAAEVGNPISATFLDACVELGYPRVSDFNAQTAGAGWQHVDIRDGRRNGVRVGYLEPALDRSNLTVEKAAMAGRLLFAGDRCVGVEYRQDGQLHTAYARHEVVVSAGAIQSPKLLMLSGIGAADRLRELDIAVQVDLPGVGENFQDHPLVIGPIGYLNEAGADPRGQVTEAALFWPSEPGLPVPDMEICIVHRAPFGDQFFANVIKRVQTGQPIEPVAALVDPHVILSLPGLVRPLSRGSVRLADADPDTYPLISANYYGEPADLDRTVQMIGIAREIYATRAFRDAWGLTEVAPGPTVKTTDELRQWVIQNTGSYYHFAGSCAMGIDRAAVVDSQLRVHGIRGLRVADASVMPSLVSANPHTTVVMIAERAAELIRAELAA